MSSSARAMFLYGVMLAIMAVPSQQAKVPGRRTLASACFSTQHDPIPPQMQQQQQQQPPPQKQRRRWRRQRRRPQHQRKNPLLPSFVVMSPANRNHDAGTAIARDRRTAAAAAAAPASTTSSFREHSSNRNPRFLSTTALAASKNKSKTKSAKKEKARNGTATGGAGGGGGFGGSSTAAASPAPPPPAAAPSQPRRTIDAMKASSSPSPRAQPAAAAAAAAASSALGGGGQLPDDDFATFPPLSPDTLKSVMGVDVFDLPPGGIPACERGQQQALPSQVLGCIRERHGLQDFAGGRRLLDPEYDAGEDSAEAAAGASSSRFVSAAAAAAAATSSPQDGTAGARDASGGSSSSSNGLLFPGLRLLHAEPPVIGVDNFFTPEECDQYVSRSLSPPPPPQSSQTTSSSSSGINVGGGNGPHKQRSATLGADVDAVAQRTSTTWFHRFSAVPELMAKASALVGVPFEEGRWEEAQTVRYRPGEKFTWHLDALPPTPELAAKGGQRIATLLVYLTEMPDGDGGATAFRDLGPLRVRPRKGSALLFFPSCGGAPGCPFDIRTLHAGEVVRPGGEQDKWIAQLWLRESRYTPTVPKQNRHVDAESVVAEFDKSWRASC